jgi:hypothetical protein
MPNLNDPFTVEELRGVFNWTPELTADLSQNDSWMYIGMHEKKLRRIIRRGRLGLGSTFDVKIGKDTWQHNCSWLSLQDWHRSNDNNHFGPFVVSIRLRELEGKRFYIFERDRIKTWKRFYFVERPDTSAMFDTPAKSIDPLSFFRHERGGLYIPKTLAQYEIVLTAGISVARAKVEATAHYKCYAGDKCYAKLDKRDSVEKLSDILGYELMPDTGPRKFPNPFPLKRVIPADKLPAELQPA